MRRVYACALAAALCLVSGGYVFGQAAGKEEANPEQKAFLEYALAKEMMVAVRLGELSPKKENQEKATEALDAMTAILVKSPEDPLITKAVIRKALLDFHQGKANARSAPQVSQISAEVSVELQLVQIAQNRRIIQLLEEGARRDAGKAK